MASCFFLSRGLALKKSGMWYALGRGSVLDNGSRGCDLSLGYGWVERITAIKEGIPLKMMCCWLRIFLFMGFLLLVGPSLAADERVHGQVLYVPVYSEVPYGNKRVTLDLTVTLSVRNRDPKSNIKIKRVDYFAADGRFVKAYLDRTSVLKPLAASEFILSESDRRGGISASFLVEWESEVSALPPVVEAIMVNGVYSQGLAFTAQARVVEERP